MDIHGKVSKNGDICTHRLYISLAVVFRFMGFHRTFVWEKQSCCSFKTLIWSFVRWFMAVRKKTWHRATNQDDFCRITVIWPACRFHKISAINSETFYVYGFRHFRFNKYDSGGTLYDVRYVYFSCLTGGCQNTLFKKKKIVRIMLIGHRWRKHQWQVRIRVWGWVPCLYRGVIY